MANAWQMVQLAVLLQRIKEEVAIEDFQTYQRLTIHLKNNGIGVRDESPGHSIGTKKQFAVQSGQFLLSKIDARNGAFGIIPNGVSHGVITGNFWAYSVDESRLFLPYFNYLTYTELFRDFCIRSSSGTTNRRYLQEDLFLAREIPLPPLAEQQRIVARIEELARRVEEARGLRRAASETIDRLLVQLAHRQDLDEATKLGQDWVQVALGEVLQHVTDRQTVNPQTTYPNLGIYSFGKGLFKKRPIEGFATSAPFLYRVRSGQFIYSRLFAFEGACGIITPDYDGYFVSGEYPTFDCDGSKVTPEFLFAYFKLPSVWKKLSAGSKGLGDRRQRVHPDRILAHRLWLPPIQTQAQIVDVLKKTDEVRELQIRTQRELEVLVPSILVKAFRGKL